MTKFKCVKSTSSSEHTPKVGDVIEGFIPWYGDTTYLRMKGVEWINATADHGGHYYLNFYDASKKFLSYSSSLEIHSNTHICTFSRDANGVETIKFSETYGTSNVHLQHFCIII